LPERTSRISIAWHLARWRHSAPGTRGLVIIAAFGVALTLPSHRIGFGDSWNEAHRIFLMLGSFAATFLIARDVAMSDELEFWLQHKGISPADWAFAKWRANLLPLAGTVLAFTLLLFAVAPLYDLQPSVPNSLALIAVLSGTVIVLSILMFGLSASGSPNATELMLLAVIATLFAPALSSNLPAPLQILLRYGLPPLLVVAELRDAVDARAWSAAARLLLHVSGWCTLVMFGGVALLERRTPKP